jgi:DNA-binding SARP family transcriptional activator
MLFGGFRLININGEALVPNSRKAKALLAWLAVNPDRQHPREKLASVLWPDSDEIQGRHSLRQALGELRKVLPDDAGPLHTTKDWILLDSGQLDVDVLDFDKALANSDDASLDRAIELYTGEFVEGCNPHSDSFDEWLSTYRNDYSVRASAAIEQRLANLLEQRDYERVAYFAVRLLGIDPLQEQAYRALLRAHAGLGNHAAALRWYRRCQNLLQRELGVTPDPATQALYTELLSGWATDTAVQPVLLAKPPAMCACPSPKSVQKTLVSSKERVLYLVEAAIEGILDNIGGQGFLIRGENATEKTALLKSITTLARSRGFSCCQREVPGFANVDENVAWQAFTNGTSACLLNQPVLLVVENIHLASMGTLKLLAGLIAAAGNGAILLVMTSCFEGEPLDPVWRGAMRGAPLTTVDL